MANQSVEIVWFKSYTGKISKLAAIMPYSNKKIQKLFVFLAGLQALLFFFLLLLLLLLLFLAILNFLKLIKCVTESNPKPKTCL